MPTLIDIVIYLLVFVFLCAVSNFLIATYPALLVGLGVVLFIVFAIYSILTGL